MVLKMVREGCLNGCWEAVVPDSRDCMATAADGKAAVVGYLNYGLVLAAENYQHDVG